VNKPGAPTGKKYAAPASMKGTVPMLPRYSSNVTPPKLKPLGISSRAINKALEAVKRVLPQYFPLLTKLEIKCYHFYTGDGWKVQEIAEYMEISIDSVQNALRRAKNKGMWWPKGLGRRKSWDDLKEKYGEEWLAKITREKF